MKKILWFLPAFLFLCVSAFAINLESGYDSGPLNADQVSLNCNNFTTNLSCSIRNVQQLADAVDQLEASGGGGFTTIGDVINGDVAFDGTAGTALTFQGDTNGTLVVADPSATDSGGNLMLYAAHGGETSGNAGNIVLTVYPATDGVDGNIQLLGGNVGIGSANPSAKLDVIGTVNATAFIGSGAGLTNLPAGSQWLTNGESIGTTGSVGIGTSTPQNMLDITGSMAVGPAFAGLLTCTGSACFQNNVGIGTTAPQALFDLYGSVGGVFAFNSGNVGIGTSTPGGSLVVMGGNVGIGSTNPQGTLDIVNSGNFIVTSAGNVGIGTSSPTDVLSVKGGFNVRTSNDSNNALRVTTNNTIGQFYIYSSGTAKVFLSPLGSSWFNGGNVGIGSTAPGHVLDVVGTSYFNGNIGIGTTNTSNASLQIDSSIYLGIGRTTGSATCITATGFLGHCTSVIGADGSCTCVAN